LCHPIECKIDADVIPASRELCAVNNHDARFVVDFSLKNSETDRGMPNATSSRREGSAEN
jgi:hypothetical protein